MEKINPAIEQEWKEVLGAEFEKPYFHQLKAFLLEERRLYRVFPPGPQIFNAFNKTPFGRVRVVVLGQDPYHGAGQAHGLCFSVPEGIPRPPSLLNIFKELHDDLGIPVAPHGNLERWAEQGVLLLNATLTVRENMAGSHQKRGWEQFTDEAIRQLSERRSGLIFVLWGNYAIAKRSLVDTRRHHVLTAAHPSPLSASRGFFGCRHFSAVNRLLEGMNQGSINWDVQIPFRDGTKG